MTAPGTAHDAAPHTDTAVTIGGRRHLRLLDLRYADCWPAEGICTVCGQVVRREAAGKPWEHTGRMPGEPG